MTIQNLNLVIAKQSWCLSTVGNTKSVWYICLWSLRWLPLLIQLLHSDSLSIIYWLKLHFLSNMRWTYNIQLNMWGKFIKLTSWKQNLLFPRWFYLTLRKYLLHSNLKIQFIPINIRFFIDFYSSEWPRNSLVSAGCWFYWKKTDVVGPFALCR